MASSKFSSRPPKLRSSDNRLQVLFQSPGEEHLEIKGAKLPTYEQVLLCYMATMAKKRAEDTTKNKKLTRTVSNLVLQKVLVHYDKANIITKKANKCAEDILKINKEFDRVNKNKSPTGIEEFRKKLRATMPFWPRGTLESMEAKSLDNLTEGFEKERLEEDIKFLRSMIGNREATYMSRDVKHQQKAMNKQQITAKKVANMELQKKQLEGNPCCSKNIVDEVDEESGLDSQPEDEIFAPPPPKRSHRRTVKVGTTITLPHNVLKSKNVVSASMRNKVSPTALAGIVGALIDDTGGNKQAVNLSYSHIYKYRLEATKSIAEEIRENWKPPAKGIVHWDGKLMQTLDGCGKEERLPILLSGIGGFKLLGVPALPHKSDQRTGDLIASATSELLDSWKCRKNVYGMSFDTTSSNTGHLTAACIAIQRVLSTPLLWLACRHHVGEVILDQVWTDLGIETSKSPDITIFKDFREKWNHLSYRDTTNLTFPKVDKKLQRKRDDIIVLLKETLKAEFTRGDYKELVELSLLYLTGDCDVRYEFKRPGALHRARWMAKLIYSFKIVLLSEKISNELGSGDILSKTQLSKLQRFVKFSVYIYIPWWLTCPVASAAPLNDLNLIANIRDYSKVNKCCADAATKAVSRHLWYLTEELVPLALFSSQVDVATKQRMANKLETHEKEYFTKRFGSSHGKPIFPLISGEIQDLVSFVGTSSWSFFHSIGCTGDFLKKPVQDWLADKSYLDAKEIVNNMYVVNDGAERGVKLCHDFLSLSKSDSKYQNILQVVENDRNKRSNQRSKKTQDKRWFLQLEN